MRRRPTAGSPQDRFVGRKEQLQVLYSALKAAANGSGGTWVVWGSAGIGKTGFLNAVQRLAERHGFHVRSSHALQDVDTPLFPWLSVFRSTPEVIETVAAPRYPARSSARAGTGMAMLRALDALEIDTEERPQLIVLDDFHWADPDSWQTLAYIARSAPRLRLLVLVATREGSPLYRGAGTPTARGEHILSHLRRENVVQELELPALEPAEIRLLAAGLLDRSEEDPALVSFVDQVFRRVGGNPYFVRETITKVLRESSPPGRQTVGRQPLSPNLLQLLESGKGDAGASISEILEGRLAALRPAERRVLEGGALVGEEFDVAPVAAITRLPGRDVATTCHRLLREGRWLRRLTPSAERYALDHALLRDTILDGLDVARRRRWNLRLAQWWTRHRPTEPEVIARLWFEAHDVDEGVSAVRRAIDDVLRSQAYGALPRYLTWLRELIAERPDAAQIDADESLRVAERLLEQGALEVRPVLEGFLDHSAPGTAQRTALAWLTLSVLSRDIREARTKLAQLESVARSSAGSPDELSAWRLAALQAIVDLLSGDREKASHPLRRCLARLPAGIRPFEVCRVYQASCLDALEQGDLRLVRRLLRQARNLVDSAGISGAPVGLMFDDYEAILLRNEMRSRESLRVLVRCVSGYQKAGAPALVCQALTNVAAGYFDIRDWEKMTTAVAQAYRLAVRLDLSGAIGHCRLIQGELAVRSGRPDDALRFFDEATRVQATRGFSPLALVSQVGAIRLRAERGELRRAWRDLKSLEQRDMGQWNIFWPVILSARARLHELSDESGSATRTWRRAVDLARHCRDFGFYSTILAEAAEFSRRHGSRRDANRLSKELTSLCRRAGVDPLPFLALTISANAVLEAGAKASGPTEGSEAGFRKLPRDAAGDHSPSTADQLLFHLLASEASHGRLAGTGPVASAFTQEGIARATGIPRGSFARTLKRLVDRKLVTEDNHLVLGERRAKRVYFLTPLGRQLAERVPLSES